MLQKQPHKLPLMQYSALVSVFKCTICRVHVHTYIWIAHVHRLVCTYAQYMYMHVAMHWWEIVGDMHSNDHN